MKGKFIVVDGLDGAGKTTLIKNIVSSLEAKGIPTKVVREPGSTPIAEKLRGLLKEKVDDETLTNKSELLLFYAARSQLLEKIIKPGIENGFWIIADRFSLSTLAYQGYGLGLIDDVKQLSRMVLGDFMPDLEILLDITVPDMRKRLSGRGTSDLIESRSDAFFELVRNGFIDAVTTNQQYTHVKVFNAMQTPDVLSNLASVELEKLVNEGTK